MEFKKIVMKDKKLFKELQDTEYAKPDYFCPPNHKMVKSSIVPKLKFDNTWLNADEYSIMEEILDEEK